MKTTRKPTKASAPPTPDKYQSAASKYFDYPWPDEQKTTEPKSVRKRSKQSIPRERKHKATSPRRVEGFLVLTRAFAQDGTLTPNAKTVAVVLASHADLRTGLVSVKPERLQEDANLGENTLSAARQELADREYIRKVPIRDSAGHIKGWKYYVTNKLVHRTTKRLPRP